MRDNNRIKPILKKIEKLWLENPDFRITQLVYVIAKTGESMPKLFYMEDEEFLEKIEELADNLKKGKNNYNSKFLKI